MSSSCFTDLAQQYIDGEWRPGTGSWDIIDFNPYDGEKLASIPIATADEVDQAYRAAARAQRAWAATGPSGRRTVFEAALRLVEERADEIAAIVAEELGGTRLRAAFEIGLAKEFLRDAARLALGAEDRVLPARAAGKEHRLHRVPVGVVGVISPFDFPFLLSIKPVAAALALGNAVVLKPHQDTPVTGGTLIAKLFEDAGLPPGLLNVVLTDIAEIGDAFIEHPVPGVISFTGSDKVGRHIATVCAGQLKRAVLELGGSSALVVLDDADLDYAVDAAVFSRYADQGRICMAAHRVLVDRTVAAEFTEKYVAEVRTLRTGDPRDPRTVIGPVLNSLQAGAISATIEQAEAEGATVLVRGRTADNLVGPSVLTDVPADSSLLHREILGPVALLVPFDGEEEAVRILNDTPNGLSGSVHTADVERGVAFARRIEAGTVHVNDGAVHVEPLVPFGGEEGPGIGRLGGESTLDAFTTLKWISVQHGRSAFPS
ncbi:MULTISPECIES: aldehyde dehydrogenase family protein [unclassified Streptomyces]|uniref:aldehyde dehydrogenase family protein n=1 Tax=unclassified Streptomyces TaxID=2593676 RepID=UPI001F038CF5|nr:MULTISPECIES: aldehyde dehydrogenase family protein [unclassified Streptomyces]MCH0565104.1 aldehyde dehydrogenase family protein [Streptomyces sp. MUM 2J]MCH0571190.1 aldehyde dehydrogenase family protein [Streptomyces sp. MUM 136J]